MFLERDAFLTELDVALAGAAGGRGCAVLVSGEAGIGKTTLLEHFADRLQTADSRTRVLWGACDALFTPRPLGPLLDMARQTPGVLREVTRGTVDRERVFLSLLDELSRPSPRTLAIFEDVHWADEATLDLLKFLVRRIGKTQSLLVLSFRDDEVDAAHPLRRVLGELPAQSARRLKLPPLSANAVARLATAAGRRAEDLHSITGGNPFYVTEVLGTGGGGIPASVRDAVLARAARLTPAATAVLHVVSIVPGRIERWLLDRMLDDPARAVQEGVDAGILRATRDVVAFRHELARRVWEDALEPAYATELHRRMIRTIESSDVGTTMLSRLVHHADRAGDADTVLRLAPAAGREAASLGAHREAAAHFGSALRYADRSPPAERAALLDAWSYEVHLNGRIADAVRAREEALTLWRRSATVAERETAFAVSRDSRGSRGAVRMRRHVPRRRSCSWSRSDPATSWRWRIALGRSSTFSPRNGSSLRSGEIAPSQWPRHWATPMHWSTRSPMRRVWIRAACGRISCER